MLLCSQFCVRNYPKIVLYACSYIITKWFCTYILYKIQFCEFVSDTFYLELMALNFTELLKWLWIAFKYCLNWTLIFFLCHSCNCLVYVTFFFAYNLFTNSVYTVCCNVQYKTKVQFLSMRSFFCQKTYIQY